jgi:hypothetical protein
VTVDEALFQIAGVLNALGMQGIAAKQLVPEYLDVSGLSGTALQVRAVHVELTAHKVRPNTTASQAVEADEITALRVLLKRVMQCDKNANILNGARPLRDDIRAALGE